MAWRALTNDDRKTKFPRRKTRMAGISQSKFAPTVANDLQRKMRGWLSVESPETFAFYWETGAPYRAFLFRVSRRTAYWVVYRVYNDERIVRVLRFRHTANEPGTHDL